MSQPHPIEDADAKRLGELGYTQEFERRMSGFSNFAISFSIISILSGCFTTFGQAWNNGGPIAISLGWPVISAFILIIGLCMSELVSAFPTAGGIYYWAFRLGKPRHCLGRISRDAQGHIERRQGLLQSLVAGRGPEEKIAADGHSSSACSTGPE